MDDPAATGLDEDASGLLEVSDVGPLEPTSGCVLFPRTTTTGPWACTATVCETEPRRAVCMALRPRSYCLDVATRAGEINGVPRAPEALAGSAGLPERVGYRLKARALGPPLTTCLLYTSPSPTRLGM